MAHKKGQGSSRNGRDSNAQRRGVKVFGGQEVTAGSILVRQVGSTFHAGNNVKTGKDYTLFALRDGEVLFKPGANGKKTVRVVDPVQRGGREDGKPSRRDKRRELYTPRAEQRAAAEAAAATR